MGRTNFTAIIAASLLIVTACEKSELDTNISEEGLMELTITNDISNTKTLYDGTNVIKWNASKPEYFQVIQNAGGQISQAGGSGTTKESNRIISIKSKIPANQEASSFDTWCIYPKNAAIQENNDNPENFKIVLHNVQNPIIGSYDPNTDILISKKVSTEKQPVYLEVNFARQVAMAEMKLTGIPIGEKISSVRFSSETAYLAGTFSYNLSTNMPIDDDTQKVKSITMNYKPVIDITPENQEPLVYFNCLPNSSESYIVEVTTDKNIYRKLIVPTKEKPLQFKTNTMTRFSVNLSHSKTAVEYNKAESLNCTPDKIMNEAGDKWFALNTENTLSTVSFNNDCIEFNNADGQQNEFFKNPTTGGYYFKSTIFTSGVYKVTLDVKCDKISGKAKLQAVLMSVDTDTAKYYGTKLRWEPTKKMMVQSYVELNKNKPAEWQKLSFFVDFSKYSDKAKIDSGYKFLDNKDLIKDLQIRMWTPNTNNIQLKNVRIEPYTVANN